MTAPKAAEVEALAERLRKGRLIRASEPTTITDHGIVWSGEVREMVHPDALAAADMIERLAAAHPSKGE